MTPPNPTSVPPQPTTQPNMISPFEQLPISVRHNIYSYLDFPLEDQVTLYTDKHKKTQTAIHLRERYNVDFNRSGQLSQPWNVGLSHLSLPGGHSRLIYDSTNATNAISDTRLVFTSPLCLSTKRLATSFTRCCTPIHYSWFIFKVAGTYVFPSISPFLRLGVVNESWHLTCNVLPTWSSQTTPFLPTNQPY